MSENAGLIATLREIYVFLGLVEEELNSIVGICHSLDVGEGELVFEEGSRGAELYLILEGAVSVEFSRYDRPDFEKVLQLHKNEVFGELALIDGESRSARIVALKNCRLMMIPKDELYRLMEEQPKLGYRIMLNFSQMLSRKLRFTNMALKDKMSL